MAAERRLMADVTDHLRKLLPDAHITISEERLPITPHMNCSNLKKDLGFQPRYTMESGMTDYLNMMRKAAGMPPVTR